MTPANYYHLGTIRQLAGQTVIYGLSSIVGRLLNYLLVPLYTYLFAPAEYGIVTELYAYAAFGFVVFVYGMETAFFRYYEDRNHDQRVFGTAMFSLIATSLMLAALLTLAAPKLAELLYYPERAVYIRWLAWILAFDALSSIPFAWLRAHNKALRFASIKLVNIGLNIGLNLFFLVLCPWVLESASLASLHNAVHALYNPSFGIGYIFVANLVASGVTLLFLLPQFRLVRAGFDPALWRAMLVYALPLIIVGLAGIINETLDRVLLKFLLPGTPDENQAQIGIYGANYKLAILMTLFIQAYRYAAEPFFFSQAKKEGGRELYARVLSIFVVVCSLMMLGILLYLDIFKYFIGPAYHEGLKVVPVLLAANLLLGIYYNLSIWYKLTGRTGLGAWVAILGALVTIGLNVLLIPILGYMGAAWATLACYAVMVVLSYALGQRYYPVPYTLYKIAGYPVLAFGVWLLSLGVVSHTGIGSVATIAFNTVLLIGYIALVWYLEKANLKGLPGPGGAGK